MTPSFVVSILAFIAAGLAYILPAERVVLELVRVRENALPLRLETALRGIVSSWPEQVTLELHPDFGLRVSDTEGGSWLLRQGRVVAGSPPRAPLWIPDIEILALRTEEGLRAWLRRARVDLSRNELARCGESDCFILGGTRSPGQVWLDKDRFEVVRVVLPEGRQLVFEGYQDWSGVRFPRDIKILDSHGPLATLSVQRLGAAPDLGADDFSPQNMGQSPPGNRSTQLP